MKEIRAFITDESLDDVDYDMIEDLISSALKKWVDSDCYTISRHDVDG